jgi:hypothetical protein
VEVGFALDSNHCFGVAGYLTFYVSKTQRALKLALVCRPREHAELQALMATNRE